MGQKVHPTIFRSKIFPVYKNCYNNFYLLKNNIYINIVHYKQILSILNTFEVLNIFFKINNLQYNMYYIILFSKNQYYKKRKDINMNLLKFNIYINMYILHHPFLSSKFILSYIISQYKLNRISLRKLIKQIVTIILNKYSIKGIKFLISGRINGVQMAKIESFKFNKVSLNVLNSYIEYNNINIINSYGVLGFKIWLFF